VDSEIGLLGMLHVDSTTHNNLRICS